MSAADDAFAEATRRIRAAQEEGAERLDLRGSLVGGEDIFDALETLPEDIASLTALKELSLRGTAISDATALAGLTGLKELDLSVTGISDASPLAGLTALKRLDLSDTGIRDVTPLAGLTALWRLSLGGTGISDASPLAGLTALTRLDLAGTAIKDATPLAGLTALKRLGLNGTGINDATPLAGLTAMEELYLRSTAISDASPLAGLTALRRLDLSVTGISDATPLAGLIALERLDLDKTTVRDLRPLTGLTRLVDGPDSFGLTFQECEATRIDDRIREISRIRDSNTRASTLFDYLEDWVPPWERQSDEGLRYRIGEDGQTEYDPIPPSAPPDATLAQFHAMLRDDTARLIAACETRQKQYEPLIEKLRRYRDGLAECVEKMNAPLTWKAGNDLRIELGEDVNRSDDDLDGSMPPLGPDRKAGLAGLVATHNVLADLHPVLSKLDQARIDAANRHKAARDAEAVGQALELFAEQRALIREEIVSDLRDLMEQALGEGNAALRALKVGDESFDNLVKVIVTQAVKEARGGPEGFLSRTKGHAEGAIVGAATVALGPQVAASFPELVVMLEPALTSVLSTRHGAGYPLVDAIKSLAARARALALRDEDDL